MQAAVETPSAEGIVGPGFREQITGRLAQWREQYAELVIDAIKASDRRRTELARALDQLCERRNRVLEALETLTIATSQRQWEFAQSRVESACRELERTTLKLVQRVRG